MWQLYLAKAQSNLQATERDRSHRAFDPCVSRAYFAAFQADQGNTESTGGKR